MIKELNYDLKKEDVLRFLRYHYYRNKALYLAFLIILIAGLVLSFMGKFETGIPIIIIGILIIVSLPGACTRGYKTQNIEIILNNESQTFNTKHIIGNTEYNWSNIEKICNTKYNFLIYILKNQAIIIPKRIFENEQEMNETWELIQECYNKNKQ